MIATTTLKFSQLRLANELRASEWTKGSKSQLGVEVAMIELAGEVGELANQIKKQIRHQAGIVGGVDNLEAIRQELADVVICADLLARKLGVDLGRAVVDKFNQTSDKHGFETKLRTTLSDDLGASAAESKA